MLCKLVRDLSQDLFIARYFVLFCEKLNGENEIKKGRRKAVK